MSNRPNLNGTTASGEAFSTPIEVVHEVLNISSISWARSILDPCAGTGNIVKALRQRGYERSVTAVEPNGKFHKALWQALPDVVVHMDFFDCTSEGVGNIGTFDLIVMNPPYSMIEGFLEKAYNQHLNTPGRIIALLRLGHLAGVRRWEFLQKYQPTSVNILSQRPAMTGGPGDIGGVAWVIFDKPMIINQTQLRWIKPRRLIRRKSHA